MAISVDSGYLLAPVCEPETLCEKASSTLQGQALSGTLVFAPEGINWSLSGSQEALARFRAFLQGLRLKGVVRNTRTRAPRAPFAKLKLRVRPELVTSGLDAERLPAQTGTHLSAPDFNALIDQPGTRLIDVRNHYEISIGTFTRAQDPNTESFTEFQDYVDNALADADRSTPLALCCTGGIRCERASQLLISKGFREVYQLEGGILAYLSQVPLDEQKFTGECFVFDSRVSVTRTLEPGSYRLNGNEIVDDRR